MNRSSVETLGFFSGEKMVNSTQQLKKNGRGKDKNGRQMHPNSLKNLENRKSWKPGQQGRHEGMTITQRQRQLMVEPCPFDGQARTWLESLAEGGMRQALTIPVALSNLQDRHEGKVTQPIKPVGENGAIATFMLVMSDGSKRTAKELAEGNKAITPAV